MTATVHPPPLFAPARPSGPLIGVEHEFEVIDARGATLDFRTLVGDLALDGRRGLDPADPLAWRCRAGHVITADGPEAEIAIAPVAVGPGFTLDAVELASLARRDLGDALAAARPGAQLRGYSTHLSVSVAPGTERRMARRFVRSLSAPLMLVLDRRDSPGLLVRPRPGRLELCGEFAQGWRLQAALVFAVAGVAALVDRSGVDLATAAPTRRPTRLRPRVEPAIERYGWYVDRRAFGPDLYELGRAAPLARRFGSITAQDHLAAAWAWVRPHAVRLAGIDEVALVDDLVGRRRPLGPEERDEQRPPGPEGPRPRRAAASRGLTEAFGAAVEPPARPGLTIVPRHLTWELALFSLQVEGTEAAGGVVAVPRDGLAEFVSRLERGTLDQALSDAVAGLDGTRVLPGRASVTEPGVWDDGADPATLLPPERDPGSGRLVDALGGGSGRLGDRHGKRRQSDQPSEHGPRRPRFRPRSLAVGGVVVGAVIVGAVVVAAQGSKSSQTAAATTTTTRVVASTTAPLPTVVGSDGTPISIDAAADLNGTWVAQNGEVRIAGSGGTYVGTAATAITSPEGCVSAIGTEVFRMTGADGRYFGVSLQYNTSNCEQVASAAVLTAYTSGPDTLVLDVGGELITLRRKR